MRIEITPIAVEPDDEADTIGWIVRFYTDRLGARMLAAHIGTSISMEFPDRHPADVLRAIQATVTDPDGDP